SEERSIATLSEAIGTAIHSLEMIENLDYSSPKAHRVSKHVRERLKRHQFSLSTPTLFSRLAMEEKYGWEYVKEAEQVWTASIFALFLPFLLLFFLYLFSKATD